MLLAAVLLADCLFAVETIRAGEQSLSDDGVHYNLHYHRNEEKGNEFGQFVYRVTDATIAGQKDHAEVHGECLARAAHPVEDCHRKSHGHGCRPYTANGDQYPPSAAEYVSLNGMNNSDISEMINGEVTIGENCLATGCLKRNTLILT